PANPNAFKNLYIPVYWDGLYGFIGSGHGATNLGIYTNLNGFLQDVVTDTTFIPSGSGQFNTFASLKPHFNNTNLLSINENNLVLLGTGQFWQSGVYQYRDQKLSMVANQKTPMPKAHGNFQYFGYPA